MAGPEYDVVISGYGPTGLAAAALLTRLGHRVCVFERWPSLYGQPRIATIDAESARIIQAACDVDAAFRNSLPRDRYIFANANGEVLIDNRWEGDHDCGFAHRISLHQPDIEDAMDAAARGRGAEIHQGWEVTAIEQDDAEVRVTAQERVAGNDSGAKRTVSARYLIGADGARSAVRELLGIEREAWPFRNAWYSVDTVRLGKLPDFWGTSPDGQIAVIFCLPEGRAHSVIPLGSSHVRFNFEADPDGGHDDKLNDEVAYRHLRDVYGVGPEHVEVTRQAVYPFEGKLALRWRVGRAFLAGDAAHVMTPFLGQGGCAAFRDAINLAWKLDLVLKGIVDEALLDSYEAERLPHVRVHVDGSDKLAAMAFEPDPEKAAARDQRYLENPAPAPAAAPDLPLVGGILDRDRNGDIAAPVGGLGPQGAVQREGTEGRFDDIVGWGFQLLAWDRNPADLLSEDQKDFLTRIGGVTAGLSEQDAPQLVRDVSGVYRRFFRRHGIEGLLMRPDFVVFGVVRTAEDLPRLVDVLRRQLGTPSH